MSVSVFDEPVEKWWPSPIVPRKRFGEFSGGAYSPGYMANLDSKGSGIEGAMTIGNQVVYPVRNAIAWLKERVKNENREAAKPAKVAKEGKKN